MSRFISYYQKPIKCEVELKMFPQSDINLIGFNALSLVVLLGYYFEMNYPRNCYRELNGFP